MKLNTNLVKVLTDLAAAAENGGINVDININVNVASATAEPSASQSESKSPEGLVPEGGPEPMIGPYESKEELGAFLVTGDVRRHGDKSSEEATVETQSKDAVAVPGSDETEKTEASTEPKASKTARPRPRPSGPGAPAAGSNGRCIKMVKQRQAQLVSMGRDVPKELMEVPTSEGQAQDLLSKLRPYLAS